MTVLDRVLVVGGGPAGLSTAWALRRAGVARHVEIVEIREDGRPEGIGLLLITPALRALAALGLLDTCLAAGEPLSVWQIFKSTGEATATVPLPNVNGPSVPPAVGVSRMRLHEALMACIDSLGVRVRMNTRVDVLRQDEEGAEVVLSDGSVERYDLVIGADGVHSRTRSMILPGSPTARSTGQMIWRASYTRKPEHDGYQVFLHGPTRVGLVPLTATSGYIWMLDADVPAGRPDPTTLLERWRERTAPYCATVQAATRQIQRPDQLDYRMLQNLVVPLPWHAGRVVLIGDAVHTTTPHLAFGVGMAFEDGLVLSEEIAAAHTLDEALMRFGQRRFERCSAVVRNAQALGECDLHPERAPRSAEQVIRESLAAMAQPL